MDDLAPSYTAPPSHELVALARQALRTTQQPGLLTGSQVDDLRSAAIGFAAAARCAHLLGAIVTLHENGQDQATGVLLRTLFETWIVGGYGLMGGPEAHQRLSDARLYQFSRLPIIASDGQLPAGRSIGTWEIAHAFSALLREQPLTAGTADFPVQAYNVLYRTESFISSHGGLGAIEGHLSSDPDRGVEVLPDRAEAEGMGRHRLALALAIYVSAAHLPRFHIRSDTAVLDEIGQRIQSWRNSLANREVTGELAGSESSETP